MKKKDQVFLQRIAKQGIYDVKALVSEIKTWFSDNEYTALEQRNITKEKDKGMEMGITIDAFKEIDDYYERDIRVEILLIRAKKVTVKDMKLDQAHIEIIITSFLVTDFKNLYHSRLAEFLKKLRDDYTSFYEKKEQVGRLYVESQEFVSTIEHTLGMP